MPQTPQVRWTEIAPDRIVDPNFVEEEDRPDDQHPRDEPDQDGIRGIDDVRARGDPDESGENSIQGHGEIRLGADEEIGDHRANAPSRRGQTGRDQHE